MDQKPDAINNIEASTFTNNSSSPKKFLTSLCKDDPNASDEFLEIEINKPADLHTGIYFGTLRLSVSRFKDFILGPDPFRKPPQQKNFRFPKVPFGFSLP